MKIGPHSMHKSLKQDELADVDLPDFAVITGANGSGKTHLLELLSFASFGPERNQPIMRTGPVRFVGSGELLGLTGPQAGRMIGQVPDGGHQLQRGLAELADRLYAELDETAEEPASALLRHEVATAAVADGLITAESMRQLAARTSRPFWELPPTALVSFAPLSGARANPFADSLVQIFRNWIQAHVVNDLQSLRQARGEHGYSRSTEEMEALVGPPPWDVFNRTLDLVGLPFQVESPSDLLDPQSASAELVHTSPEMPISRLRMEDLSSGERTLLGLALVLVNLTAVGVTARVPAMVALDEPDATLHPSMVDRLLRMLRTVFFEEFGVRVVLATHSPSTVALAPPESVMLMSRSSVSRLRRVDTDAALAALTVGIPTLSVRSEHRRQVFVEATFDERVYTTLWNLLGDRLGSPITPVFIASGGSEQVEARSGGSSAVKSLVRKLREAGSNTALGIVDRDASGGSPEAIYQIQDRYAVENLLLDPLLLGVRLVNVGALTMEQLGLAANTKTAVLLRNHAQLLVNYICKELDFSDGVRRDVLYVGGQTLQVPAGILDFRGHDLDKRVLESFPKLKRDQSGSKDGHLMAIAHTTVREYPEAVPHAVLELFATVTRT
jgi:energy-coupling factor transporter ATP-binding protein EcfA2